MSEAFERVRDTLHTHGSKIADNRQGHFMAQCPAHEDGRPSLGVDDGGDKVLLRCYAGCNPDEILAQLGLEFRDLFDSDDLPDRGEFGKGHLVRSYVYERTNGEPWIIKDRWYPKFFTQRLPGTQPGDRSGLNGRAPILYRAPQVWRCLQTGECTVWLVEGEKDVESAEKQGLVATCTPGGAGSRWQNSYTQFLRHAQEVVIVADQDAMKANGELGSGQQHAAHARDSLRAAGVKVRVVAPAAGKDLTDHFAAGYTVEDFVVEPTAYIRPRGMTAADLMVKEFDPITFAVDKILPAGLTICAGSPKAGKSWLALDLCLAVALGGPAISALGTDQGCALYLAREDTYRRLQSRMALIMGGTMEGPKALELIPQEHDWPGGDEGLAYLTEWAEECGTPRLVVLDTLAKIEPDMGEDGKRGAYGGNYSMMAKYKAWADLHNCAVLMIHHDRKTLSGAKSGEDGWMDEDPFTRISGTRGLTGAADTLWFLETKRGTPEGRLHITGRDVVEQFIELRKTGPLWNALHQPD